MGSIQESRNFKGKSAKLFVSEWKKSELKEKLKRKELKEGRSDSQSVTCNRRRGVFTNNNGGGGNHSKSCQLQMSCRPVGDLEKTGGHRGKSRPCVPRIVSVGIRGGAVERKNAKMGKVMEMTQSLVIRATDWTDDEE